ncbi:MmgE/PrpD family protein [Consotaella aegiceratis]|uniref:MmgE/PrpD family protein n=1 Tax=Consotaella aegiceratis TaxID=3097961 RepID=UPI002F429725
MSSVIEDIAAWSAAGQDFSAVARQRAVHAIADTIGCMIAGADDFSTEAVRQGLSSAIGANGPAHVAGGGTAEPTVAALVNGTAAHALDFDDNFAPAMSHASAVLVPAILAVAEATDAGGSELIDAYLIGLEAQAWVGQGMRPWHYTAGWHATATVGAIGTAAATAWLVGRDAPTIARAMSLATSTACGLKGQFGTPVKPFHAGVAARAAVEAALFAKAGLTGRLDILEAPQGFLELFGAGEAPGWSDAGPGARHVIEEDGLMPKRHPCCGSTHLAVDMILDLRREHGFSAEDVASIALRVGIANARNLAYPDPQNEMEARFSMQYCVARALRQDVLSVRDFTPEAVFDPSVRALLPITSMTPFSVEEERAEPRRAHEITLSLKDGRRFFAKRKHAKGTIQFPFTDGERLAKFRDCCGGTRQADDLYAAIDDLDQASTVAALGAGLSGDDRLVQQAALG